MLPLRVGDERERKQLNYAVHFALGGMWGTAYGLAAAACLHGQRAVTTVFAIVYTGDVLLNTALGLYEPQKWSRREWTVDIVDKYVQAAANGAIFDRVLAPA